MIAGGGPIKQLPPISTAEAAIDYQVVMSTPDADKTSGAVPAGIDVEPVTAWMAANIDGVRPPFRFAVIEGGHSNLTFDVLDDGGRRMVLRRPPLGAVLATAHDMEREHRVISGIGLTSVPVPKALGLCRDETVNGAPFYVMDFVSGVVLHDEAAVESSLPDDEQRGQVSKSVVDVMAALHTAVPADVGLGDLGRTEGYVDRQLKRWRTQWENTKTRRLPAMDQAYERLVDSKPEQRYTGIVHGDYRLGNMLIDTRSCRVAAVLDWELCTLGDVLADVGYLLNNWLQPGEDNFRGATAFPTQAGGFWTRPGLVEAYCDRTGFDRDHVTHYQQYYQAFQYWRLAAIVEGVLSRYLKGVMGDGTVDTDSYRDQVTNMATTSVALLDDL